ncbi:DUF998 domain-containing protein [Solihabitans fulvus]|uniref:DUF998 domain-containing protein n=1 Tax=Solihabitans fulvus TaxID=1892852 RepID=A0A5B2WQM3_9PSEU|nr:DUF998 domain-containing protein [Solihabitans fulvus]KAA2254031.1 DUF998 domain-containing protein [Solihabitans fulvus]
MREHGSERWVHVALGCFAVSVLAIGYLHVDLRGRVDPLAQVVSDYALVGSGADLFDVGVCSLAAGTVALLVGLTAAGAPQSRPVRALFGAWCLGLVLCALFPTSPTGSPLSMSGQVHRFAGGVMLVSLPLAGRLFAGQLDGEQRWRAVAARVRTLSRWSVVALVAFVLSQVPEATPGLPGARLLAGFAVPGLAERVLMAVELAVLVSLGLATLRAERKPLPC